MSDQNAQAIASTDAPTTPEVEAPEGFEGSVYDAFEELAKDIERAAQHAASSAFHNKLQSKMAIAIRDEIRDNVYEILKKYISIDGEFADRFEVLEEDFDVVREVVAQLKGKMAEFELAMREIVTNGVLGAAAMLAKLTLERSQDLESKVIAERILQALGQLTAPSTQQQPAPSVEAQPQQNPSG